MNYQERVKIEKEELDIKLNDLIKFIQTNKTFQDLSNTEQRLLKAQQHSMECYSIILETRLILFEKTNGG